MAPRGGAIKYAGHAPDLAALNELLRGPTGGVVRDLTRRGLRVQTVAKRLAPADSGRLRSSITITLAVGSYGGNIVPIIEVGTNVEYALMVHEGTGVFGPHKTPIMPVNGRYLVFTVKGGGVRDAQGRYVAGKKRTGRVVYARSVKGQAGKPYLKKALAAVRG